MPKTEVRPGLVIRSILTGEIPVQRQVLAGGRVEIVPETVSQASVTEMYREYKRLVRENRTRRGPRAVCQKGMCYDSFRKLLWYPKRLGYIRAVGRGNPVPDLMMIEGKLPDARVVDSAPIYYAITPQGQAAEDEWDNLQKAWNSLGLPQEELPRRPEGTEETVTDGSEPEAGASSAVATLWEALAERIKGWARPNSANAERLLDNFLGAAAEAGYDEGEVALAVQDVRDALEEYQGLSREDFSSGEEYLDARSEAWENFLQALDEVDVEALEAP